MTALHLRNCIDGAWVDATGNDAFEDTDPATGELIATATKSTVEDVRQAVEAARRAADGWRLTPAPKRGEILYRAGELMLRRKEELAREMTREMGKVLAEARGDVQEGIDMTYYCAGEGRRQFGDVVPAELPDKWAMSMRQPLGVVAAITPWNFPFAIPTWKLMPALVLGNTVVFKPASYTPMLAVRLVEILEEAGLPKGVLNLVLGPGGELGDHLVQHPGAREGVWCVLEQRIRADLHLVERHPLVEPQPERHRARAARLWERRGASNPGVRSPPASSSAVCRSRPATVQVRRAADSARASAPLPGKRATVSVFERSAVRVFERSAFEESRDFARHAG